MGRGRTTRLATGARAKAGDPARHRHTGDEEGPPGPGRLGGLLPVVRTNPYARLPPCRPVAVPRARSPDEIFSQVQDHDRVLVPEAPLARALDRRVTGARLGRFARTPAMAASGSDPPDERELFATVVRETNVPWKRAAFLLQEALSAWEEGGSPLRLREHPPAREGEDVDAVLDVLHETPNAYRARHEHREPGGDVAVVAPHLMTPLDRTVLPDDATTVDLFTSDPWEPEPVRVLPNVAAVVETVLSALEDADPEDLGVVLGPAGDHRPLLEARLEARGIPYQREDPVAEDPTLRAFLRVLRLREVSDDLRVSDVRPILRSLDHRLSRRHDEKRLSATGGLGAESLRAFWEGLGDATLGEAAEAFIDWSPPGADPSPETLRSLLLDLDAVDEPVTADALDALEFYLDAYDPPKADTRDGVLLSTPNVGTVDRPLVLLLGVDATWTQPAPDRPWIDRVEWGQRDRARFLRLLQAGRRREALVRDAGGGRPIPPSLHLHEVHETDFTRFTDLPHTRHGAPPEPEGPGFRRTPLDVEPEPVEALSASDLNALLRSPRDWFFDQLVPSADSYVMARGTLLHAFAEYLANNPDRATAEVVDEAVGIMLHRLEPFLRDDETRLEATTLRVAAETVAAFLEEHPPEDVDLPGYQASPGSNPFVEALGGDVGDPRAEPWFQDTERGLKGKVDLLLGPDEVVDYKTRRSTPSTGSLARGCFPHRDPSRIDVQPIHYLTHHRGTRPGRPLAFHLVALLANVDRRLQDDADPRDIVATLRYHPDPFPAFAASREAFDLLVEGVGERNDRRRALEGMGFPRYRAFLVERDLPDFTDRDAVLASSLAADFEDWAVRHAGDYKYVRRGARSALKELNNVRLSRLFAEDADAHQDLVTDALASLNGWLGGRFPPQDPDPDDLDHPDLVLTHR